MSLPNNYHDGSASVTLLNKPIESVGDLRFCQIGIWLMSPVSVLSATGQGRIPRITRADRKLTLMHPQGGSHRCRMSWRKSPRGQAKPALPFDSAGGVKQVLEIGPL